MLLICMKTLFYEGVVCSTHVVNTFVLFFLLSKAKCKCIFACLLKVHLLSRYDLPLGFSNTQNTGSTFSETFGKFILNNFACIRCAV